MNDNVIRNRKSPFFINFPSPSKKILEEIFSPIWPERNFDFIEKEPFEKAFETFGEIDRDYNLKSIKNADGVTVKYVMEVPYTPFSKDEIKVSLAGNTLNVSMSEKKDEKNTSKEEDKANTFHVHKISKQNFSFAINLERLNIMKKQISAVCKDGILAIEMPVFQPKQKPEENFEITVS